MADLGDLLRRGVTQGAPPDSSVPEEPKLRADIAGRRDLIEWMRQNGRTFNSTNLLNSRELRNSREALLSILSPAQYGQLYHYGFIEQWGKSGVLYRIHYVRGNNVSLIENGDTHASIGLCCYIYSDCRDDIIVSNVLALRTDDSSFRATACYEPPYEAKIDDKYYGLMHRASSRFLRW